MEPCAQSAVRERDRGKGVGSLQTALTADIPEKCLMFSRQTEEKMAETVLRQWMVR